MTNLTNSWSLGLPVLAVLTSELIETAIETIGDHGEHRRGYKRSRRKLIFFVWRRFEKYLIKMLPFIRYYLDLLIDFVFGLYYSRIQRVKGPEKNLVLESAVYLAKKIRERELKSEDVVRAFIDRIKEVNPTINAVVDNCFHQAIKEARRIDEDIASGAILDPDFEEKPFLGIPFTTKESIAVRGLSNTFGLLNRKNFKALYDAEVVTRMKNAGGIVIAVTNVPQLKMWQETSNPVYGLTCNPYNTTRNAGGSSGGEASNIAACGSPIGIGTDIGGSLRNPAFMCGIFTHKPTSNLISTHGLTFRTGKETNTMLVAGPMTKYAEDLTPFFKVLLGDNVDKLKLDDKVDITKVRVFYLNEPRSPFVSPMRKEMKKLMSKVVDHFREISIHKPELLYYDEFKFGGKLWWFWMGQEPNANFNRDLANREGEVNTVLELLKFLLGRSEYNIAVMLVLLNSLLPTVDDDWARETTTKLHEKLVETLSDDGILLYPSSPWPANYHHTAVLRPWNSDLFTIWNALKFPVTQVPMGLSKKGLPLGIQVVAAPYQDHLAIAVAKELEKTFGGYVPPFCVSR